MMTNIMSDDYVNYVDGYNKHVHMKSMAKSFLFRIAMLFFVHIYTP
jgi:hypothetical protein